MQEQLPSRAPATCRLPRGAQLAELYPVAASVLIRRAQRGQLPVDR